MRSVVTICVLILLVPVATRAGYKDDIGYTRLQSVLGVATPDGTNVAVSHVEGGASYMPDTNNVEFVGKQFNNVSASSTNASAHATYVGKRLYGLTTSIAPAVDTIDVYSAGDWLGSGFLNNPSTLEPEIETNLVQNHSWISSEPSPLATTDIVQRLDYAMIRDGFVCVAALNNAVGVLPKILGHSYNAISVGRSDGIHSYGVTALDGAGRTKPEMVAPITATSYATPMVGAASAMLLEHARDNPALSNAIAPECIKALLMGGATKQEFSDWDRTHSRPIDDIYGAGELNIYNSFFMLDEGEQLPSPTVEVPLLGWDHETITAVSTSRYFFAVEEGRAAIRVSAMLVWNREVIDATPGKKFDPLGLPLANLDLRLYEASGFVPDTLVDWSTSLVDNVEHIYAPQLQAGQYMFEVVSDRTSDYAFAWYSETIDVPRLADVMWTNDCIGFTLNVSTSYTYTVEATTNLLDPEGWTPIVTSTPPTSPYVYIDADCTNYIRRYYRIMLDDTP